MTSSLLRSAQALLGEPLSHAAPMSGGDLADVITAQRANGDWIVLKSGPAPQTEAAMLKALNAAGAPTPNVLGSNDQVLVLEHLPNGGSLARSWEDLARVMTEVHSAQGTQYGWPEDYAFANVAIDNASLDHWPQFWAERRLLCHLPHLNPPLARRLEALCARLDGLLPARPVSSLLHGDLWSGNIVCDARIVTGLIDPACYYGHAEVDLAMLCLFASPAQSFWDSYPAMRDEEFKVRQAIYTLWPALVHLRLFGRSYEYMVDQCLTGAGA